MEGEDAGDAVQALVDAFTEKGLRDWLYRVDDPKTGRMIGYFNGWGERVDTTLVEQAAEAIRNSKNNEVSDVSEAALPEPEPVEETDDSDLEQYAEELNNGASHA
jgi:hypothetical protein